MSVKAWSDEDESKLVELYKSEGVKDVHELAGIFDKG